MKRLGALVAAVLLVVVALWVRGRLGDSGGLQLGGGDASGTVICATELTRACESLREKHPNVDFRIQSAGYTAFAIDGVHPGGPDFDVWLAPQPWAGFAAELLRDGGAASLGAPSKPVAHSRLAFYVHQSRAAAFTAHCGPTPGWRCLFSAVAAPSWESVGGQAAWGKVKPYIARPLEASGLLALGGAAAGMLEPPIDGAVIRDSSELVGSLSSLKRAQALSDRPPSAALTQMLAAGPSVTDVVVALESERDRFGAAAASKATLLYPAPVVSAEIVAVPRRGSENAESLLELLAGDAGKEALTSTGWESGAAPAARKNSPSVGSHITLREIWEEIR